MVSTETRTERSEKLAWWREARFGLFVHWGVYAVPGGFYEGNREPYYAEWLMLRAKIPCETYRAYARQFTADAYDPQAWVRAAKNAGMRYLVITTKHHDGFALFNSSVNDWTITHASPYGRDALGELVEACRREQMPIGFYYSQAQDWMNGGAATGGHWDPSQKRDMTTYVEHVVIPHLRELLTNYGPDAPAMLWWDTPVGMDEAKSRRIEAFVRELRPDVIMNNRLYAGHTGDILTPEQRIPAVGYPGRDWETCMTMNKTWGFAHDDEDWKSSSELIRNLVDIVSKGGNYLLNVGPDARGRIPAGSLSRLAEIGAWMQVYGESIIGVQGVTIDAPMPWGRCTTKGKTLYVHVFDWPADGELTVPVAAAATDAWLMRSAGAPVKIEPVAGGLRLRLPLAAPNPIDSVVAIRLLEELPRHQLPLNRPADDDVLNLPAAHAEMFNAGDPEVLPTTVLGGKEGTLTYWKCPDEACRWRASVSVPGDYLVRMHYSVGPEQAGSGYELIIDNQTIEANVAPTPSWTDYEWHDVGTVTLESGREYIVTLKPTCLATGGGFLNLKAISLSPRSAEVAR